MSLKSGAKKHLAMRQAAGKARRELSALEGFISRYVERGTDTLGAELTRTQFRVKLTEQTDALRRRIEEVATYAVLEG